MICTDRLTSGYYSMEKLSKSNSCFVGQFIGNIITYKFTDEKGVSNKKKLPIYFVGIVIDEYDISLIKKIVCNFTYGLFLSLLTV